jgi:hypothetical protein
MPFRIVHLHDAQQGNVDGNTLACDWHQRLSHCVSPESQDARIAQLLHVAMQHRPPLLAFNCACPLLNALLLHTRIANGEQECVRLTLEVALFCKCQGVNDRFQPYRHDANNAVDALLPRAHFPVQPRRDCSDRILASHHGSRSIG